MFRTVAITVAGSDSGGGAGIQTDLAAFRFFGVFGTTAITALTAQNPASVVAVHPAPPDTVAAQMRAVFEAFSVGAVKTGMLFSKEIIEAVVEVLSEHEPVPVVVDPVMLATSGGKLLRDEAVEVLRTSLLHRAHVITPNLPEAEILVDHPINTLDDMHEAAAELAREHEALVLIKGGHTQGEMAVDVASDGKTVRELAAPRIQAKTTHGTGCSLSAAATACLARGDDLWDALRNAKAYVLGCLENCQQVGMNTWAMWPPERLPVDRVCFTS